MKQKEASEAVISTHITSILSFLKLSMLPARLPPLPQLPTPLSLPSCWCSPVLTAHLCAAGDPIILVVIVVEVVQVVGRSRLLIRRLGVEREVHHLVIGIVSGSYQTS